MSEYLEKEAAFPNFLAAGAKAVKSFYKVNPANKGVASFARKAVFGTTPHNASARTVAKNVLTKDVMPTAVGLGALGGAAAFDQRTQYRTEMPR